MNTPHAPGRRRSAPRRNSPGVRRGSWISLFAMLMIFIGPLISQSMPMDHAMPMNMSVSMDMGDGAPGCHGESPHHAQPGKSQGEQHVLWEKCGYCSLLFNCPALPSGLSFAALSAPPTQHFLIPATRLGHARQTVFPGALTRAPPILV
ncbi:DUF2946 domain-containing protein [Pseudomonas protegens]|uniref:DUF2946 domain-containing protein n=2 Tax=Pseudomonas TaxID=286 RepID=UPI0014756FA4|nr:MULTISPECIES: DUF2946 domain-containing protein [Pseudomonas]MDP9504250.1 DUF2946 domain-containing protein [Pseudomonas protegens]NMY68298.1 DUF2946 domain-containing protein [Pseudomonas sp. WS 5414]